MPTRLELAAKLKSQWRHQVIGRRSPRWIDARKGLVAVAFFDSSQAKARFVEIGCLLVVLVHEDKFYSVDGNPNDRAPLRLAAYRVTQVPHGVLWGGTDNALLFKDLTLAPNYMARGQRLDLGKLDLLRTALELDSWLSLAARHSSLRRPRLTFPHLWAAFRSRDAGGLHGEGPEFERACERSRLGSGEVFERSRRLLDGLTAYPMEWVSGELHRAVTLFARMDQTPKRQVVTVRQLRQDLMGYWGASEFDLYSSRFRRNPLCHPVGDSDECAAFPAQAQSSRT
jgi:hypothetical protein